MAPDIRDLHPAEPPERHDPDPDLAVMRAAVEAGYYPLSAYLEAVAERRRRVGQ